MKLHRGNFVGVTCEVMKEIFFLLKLPSQNLARKSGGNEDLTVHFIDDICDVVFKSAQLLVFVNQFPLGIMESSLELRPREYEAILLNHCDSFDPERHFLKAFQRSKFSIKLFSFWV